MSGENRPAEIRPHIPPLYVGKEVLLALTTLSSSNLQELINRREFPAPRILSGRRVGWLYREVMEWAENRPISSLPPPPNTGAKKPRQKAAGPASPDSPPAA